MPMERARCRTAWGAKYSPSLGTGLQPPLLPTPHTTATPALHAPCMHTPTYLHEACK